MTPTPFISVIIPTCYREEMLIDCVASLLRQAYSCFEIIIIDQAPESPLEAVLAKRFEEDQRIRYMHIIAAGAARARNMGVKAASGVIVAFIDDDATAEPGWLRGVADAFADNLRPALMAGRLVPVWAGARPEWYPREREYLLGLYDIGDEFCRMPACDLPIGANMAGLREVILTHGGFEETLGPNYFRKRKMVTGEETVLGRRIRAAGHALVYQPSAIVKHHVSRKKQSRRFFLRRHFWEGVTIAEQMKLLGQVGDGRWPHYRYHTREIRKALAKFVLPRHGAADSEPSPVIRMLALAKLSYSLGILWGLGTGRSKVTEKKQCASA